jgi:hypothetical protein
VPGCIGSQLSAVYINSTAAAGTPIGEYGFENLTARTCDLSGYPRVQMLTRTGAALPTTSQRTAKGAFGITATPVTLAKHAIAYFAVTYASQTGFGRLRCPTSAALRLTPPGGTAGLLLKGGDGQIRPYDGTTVHLQCGIVRASPVTAKRFQ